MAASCLWLKGFHVAVMVSWFAGLFYLPRLFVQHARTGDARSRERFETMEWRRFVIMTVGAALTVLPGYVLVLLDTAVVAAFLPGIVLLAVAGPS